MTTEIEPDTVNEPIEPQTAETQEPSQPHHRINPIVIKSAFILLVFILGIGSGFFMGRMSMKNEIVSSNGASAAAVTLNS